MHVSSRPLNLQAATNLVSRREFGILGEMVGNGFTAGLLCIAWLICVSRSPRNTIITFTWPPDPRICKLPVSRIWHAAANLASLARWWEKALPLGFFASFDCYVWVDDQETQLSDSPDLQTPKFARFHTYHFGKMPNWAFGFRSKTPVKSGGRGLKTSTFDSASNSALDTHLEPCSKLDLEFSFFWHRNFHLAKNGVYVLCSNFAIPWPFSKIIGVLRCWDPYLSNALFRDTIQSWELFKHGGGFFY